MIKLIIEFLLMGLAVLVGAYIVPGVSVDGFGSALLAAVLIAITNATIGTILRVFTFPLNFLTLGLMSFIISVLMILLVDHWMEGFNTTGFLAATVFALVLALVKAVIGLFVGRD